MKKQKTRWYYLHMLNGRVAAYDGRQVCYLWHGAPLCDSLKQLYAEQRASSAWRERQGLSTITLDSYGYRRVRLPESH